MYCNKCGALLSNGNNYCQQCGSYIPDMNNQISYTQFGNTNNFASSASILNQIKKMRIVSLLGVFSPIITNFFILSIILFIFIKGPLNGNLDNLNYINHYEFEEFALTYGILYMFTLLINVATVVVMVLNFRKVSKIQSNFCHNNWKETLENINKLKFTSVIVITVISAVLSGFIFAIPQIVFCVIMSTALNEIKRNVRLLSYTTQK